MGWGEPHKPQTWHCVQRPSTVGPIVVCEKEELEKERDALAAEVERLRSEVTSFRRLTPTFPELVRGDGTTVGWFCTEDDSIFWTNDNDGNGAIAERLYVKVADRG